MSKHSFQNIPNKIFFPKMNTRFESSNVWRRKQKYGMKLLKLMLFLTFFWFSSLFVRKSNMSMLKLLKCQYNITHFTLLLVPRFWVQVKFYNFGQRLIYFNSVQFILFSLGQKLIISLFFQSQNFVILSTNINLL